MTMPDEIRQSHPCLDAVEQMLPPREFIAYCWGAAMARIWHINDMRDYAEAAEYLRRASYTLAKTKP